MRAAVEEVFSSRENDLLELYGKLTRVVWEFIKIDIKNFMDMMGHPLNPADIDRIIRMEIHELTNFLLRDDVRDFLKEKADEQAVPMFRECVEGWGDGGKGPE